MRLARVELADRPRLASVAADGALEVLPEELGDVDDYVRGDDEHRARIAAAVGSGMPHPAGSLPLLAPLARFRRDILCTGWNYWDHFEESRGKREGQDPLAPPEHPTFFTKGPDTVIGPYDDIAFDPELSTKWDYEAEIVVVIGQDGRSIDEAAAWQHIVGFCLANDVSQRDLQRAHGGQWLKGKSIDRTMPLGPWLTTVDEIDEVDALPIACDLDGRRMQEATVAQMAFTIPRLIAELSRGMTLRAGDVLLTGTPAGIGNAREPQVFLADGNEITTLGGPLGELRNRVARTTL
ncbi:fumarylacetoacetate hydrolase family protein [Jiangella endophytica]|uniref:fumarylacetoacetate hydrolase family protein n=1 Tax=Jiangella endophytica TaxID=1623398 RepID=UPI000E357574|nr:fumarylacetoacetate hydrolase family protein [Jiangella endophytica]